MSLRLSNKGFLYLMGIVLVSFSISPLCVVFMTIYLPYNFSELFLIPGFIFILISKSQIKNIIRYNLKRKQFRELFFLVFFFFVLGIITGENIAYSYADFRTIAIFLFFAILRIRDYKGQELMKKMIYHIFITLSILDLFFLYFRTSFFNIEFDRFIVMAICPFIVSIILLNKNKFLPSSIFLGILVYESVVSTMRVNYILIIFYIIYMLVLFLNSLKNKQISIVKVLLFISIVTVFSVKITPIIANYLQSSGSRYLHSVIRTENTLNDFEDEEAIRINTTFLFLKEPFEFLLPQGLGWRNHIQEVQSEFRKEYGVLSTMDSNIFYCIYHFGIVIGLIVIFQLFKMLFSLLFRLKKYTTFLGFMYYFIIVLIISSMFILKSWIFVYLNFGLIYSLLIVLIRYPDKHLFKQKYQHITV